MAQSVLDRSDVEWTNAEEGHTRGIWTPFGRETRTLPKGWTKEPGVLPMGCDTIWDKDVPVVLRDGTTLYADIFRPETSETEKVPAILIWSPYGKSGNGLLSLNLIKFRAGIPKNATSGLENWEAPDPAKWCKLGYALVHVVARGCFDSEGSFIVNGTQEGRDGYDAIEWVAEQSWCTGKIGMAGNSWLTSTQWFIAAERPPHLTAIAPWEGLGDFYRETICRGGIPDATFWETLFGLFGGQNKREDIGSMVRKFPLVNDYWLDKKPNLSNITIPMMATMSYSTLLHTEGSFRGFFLSSSTDKWLRIHDTQEWFDIYQEENLEELQSFFGFYLQNKTGYGLWDIPHIRIALLGYNRSNVIKRDVIAYPPPEFKLSRLYLDAVNMTLQSGSPASETATVSYNAELRNDKKLETITGCRFVHTFSEYTELCGWSKATLYMSTDDSDDMDVYVVLRKLDKDGLALQSFNIPFAHLPEGTKRDDIPFENVFRYIGPNGRLRASHRQIGLEPGLTPEQRNLFTEAYVWHPHDKEEKLTRREVYKLEITLWPGGVIFDGGESLCLEVKGFHPIMPEFEGILDKIENRNIGRHCIHTGHRYPSSLMIPLSTARPSNDVLHNTLSR